MNASEPEKEKKKEMLKSSSTQTIKNNTTSSSKLHDVLCVVCIRIYEYCAICKSILPTWFNIILPVLYKLLISKHSVMQYNIQCNSAAISTTSVCCMHQRGVPLIVLLLVLLLPLLLFYAVRSYARVYMSAGFSSFSLFACAIPTAIEL